MDFFWTAIHLHRFRYPDCEWARPIREIVRAAQHHINFGCYKWKLRWLLATLTSFRLWWWQDNKFPNYLLHWQENVMVAYISWENQNSKRSSQRKCIEQATRGMPGSRELLIVNCILRLEAAILRRGNNATSLLPVACNLTARLGYPLRDTLDRYEIPKNT